VKKLIILILTIVTVNLYSQDINGKLGINGQFIIRDSSTTFLAVSQSSGNLTLYRSLSLPLMTGGSSIGTIFKGGKRFIHDYSAPGTAGNNIFLGFNAGNFNLSGPGVNASYNTGVGSESLNALTTGRENSAVGTQSIARNTSGSGNSAIGYFSLHNNLTGNYNTALGWSALFGSSSGSFNCAVGHQAGLLITTGSNNVVIGNSANVPDGTASNQVRIGNESITYAGVQVAWTITSDRRWKANITESNLGLGFISKLKPVSYTRINDENARTEYGFIAQEVEEVLNQEGIENTGMLTIDNAGKYELRYNDLLAPMVKAIQELRTENENKSDEITKLQAEIEQINKLKEEVASIKKTLDELQKLNSSIKEAKLGKDNN
jgi:hypothetical protein